MPDEKLVLVERFEELKTGMRVKLICKVPSCFAHIGIVGDELRCRPLMASGLMAPGELTVRDILGDRHTTGQRVCFWKEAVRQKTVFRFASDLGIDDQIAAEQNPYLSRSVVGTGGVDEVRVPAKGRR